MLVLSAPILAECREAGAAFEATYCGSDFEAFAALIVANRELIYAPAHLPEQACADAADDMFLACALAAGIGVVVSGDRRLRGVSGWNGIQSCRRGNSLKRICRNQQNALRTAPQPPSRTFSSFTRLIRTGTLFGVCGGCRYGRSVRGQTRHRDIHRCSANLQSASADTRSRMKISGCIPSLCRSRIQS